MKTVPGLPSRIRQRRKLLKMTQAHLAKALGVSPTSVTDWETGKTRPWENLERLASALEVTTDWLLSGDPAKAPAEPGAAPVSSSATLPPEATDAFARIGRDLRARTARAKTSQDRAAVRKYVQHLRRQIVGVAEDVGLHVTVPEGYKGPALPIHGSIAATRPADEPIQRLRDGPLGDLEARLADLTPEKQRQIVEVWRAVLEAAAPNP